MPPTIFSGRQTGRFGGSISFDWVPNPLVVAERYSAGAAHLEDMYPPLALAREAAIADIRMHFETETAPDGSPWAPLSPEYAARKPGGAGILRLTDAMYSAATSRGSFDIMSSPSAGELFINTGGLPFYWVFHQEGTTKGISAGLLERAAALGISEQGMREGMPARPFMGMSDEAQLQILEIFDEWVAAAISIISYPSRGGFTRSVVRGAGGRFVG